LYNITEKQNKIIYKKYKLKPKITYFSKTDILKPIYYSVQIQWENDLVDIQQLLPNHYNFLKKILYKSYTSIV